MPNLLQLPFFGTQNIGPLTFPAPSPPFCKAITGCRLSSLRTAYILNNLTVLHSFATIVQNSETNAMFETSSRSRFSSAVSHSPSSLSS